MPLRDQPMRLVTVSPEWATKSRTGLRAARLPSGYLAGMRQTIPAPFFTTTEDTMSDAVQTTEAAPKPSVIEKLKAYKAAQDGNDALTLKGSGVVVSMPKFKPYSTWQTAQRLGGSNNAKIQEYYATLLCTFDGERLSVGDYRELIPAGDHLEIIGKIFGGSDAQADGSEDDSSGK